MNSFYFFFATSSFSKGIKASGTKDSSRGAAWSPPEKVAFSLNATASTRLSDQRI